MAQQLLQQPITSIGSWDGVRQIDCIVNEAEDGFFWNAARLVDQIMRDDRINSTITTRILALIGKTVEWEPAKDTARGRKIAEEIETDWSYLFPHSAVVELMTWGLVLGVGVAQVIEDKDGWTIEVWHPWALSWNLYKGAYLLQPRGQAPIEIIEDPEGGYTDAEGRRWILFTPYGYANPGRRGLLRSLAHLYLERQWAHRDRARYSEIHGQPIRVGIAPLTASQAEVASYADNLSPVGAEPVVVVRQGEPGNAWDLKLVEAMGRSQELFQQEIEDLNRAIATLVLGQSQSTDGQAGLGSNDQAGEPIRVDIMRGDEAAFTSMVHEQFLVPYCAFTYGDGDMAPWMCIQVEPPEDTERRARELQSLADALVKLDSIGAPVNIRELLEHHDVPLLTEEEAAAMEAEKKAEAMAQAQAQAAQMQIQPPNGQANGAAKPAKGIENV